MWHFRTQVRPWAVLFVVACMGLLLVGCTVHGDLTFSPATAAAGEPAPPATPLPVAAVPVAGVITQTMVSLFPPAAAVSDLGTQHLDWRVAGTEVMSRALESFALGANQKLHWVVVAPVAADDPTLRPTILFSSTAYVATGKAALHGKCQPFGMLLMAVPGDLALVGPQAQTALNWPLPQVCWMGETEDVFTYCTPPACTPQPILAALAANPDGAPDALPVLYLRKGKKVDPGGEGQPPYCGYICPNGGGLCQYIGC